jgi:predicted TIM-barrel fold metal-dependent hydrolase
MGADFPVIDADSHKCENPVTFLDYVAPEHRSRIGFVRDRYGEQRIRIVDRDPRNGREFERLFLQPEGFGKGTYRPYHAESTIGGLFNRVRIEHMDREGIDHQVIYGSVALSFNSAMDPELCVALCRAYNDYIHEDCAAYPDRLHPVCVLPLQAPDQAVEELRRCIEGLGMVGAMLPPNLAMPHPAAPDAFPDVRVPRHLSDPAFGPIFAEAERLDVALGIHGACGFQLAGGASDQLDTFTLVHVFANRDMQQMAMAKLIFDGVLEEHPSLRFGFLEAGCGWLPDFLHNLREHWEKRIVGLDTSLEPSPARFLMELGRERSGKSGLALGRKARGLLQMLFTPSDGAASPQELEAFQREHPKLVRDPHEYVTRGQIFVTTEPDDPAPGYLPTAMGDVGRQVACFAVDYGHWDATLEGCVGLVTDDPRLDVELAQNTLGRNALRLYGKRLKERIAW